MAGKELLFGSNPVWRDQLEIEGRYNDIDQHCFYEIENYDGMPPFLTNLTGSGDHWFYISSWGGLTCGRWDADHALFPYYTDDKIHDGSETSGSYSAFLVERDKRYLWKPFSLRLPRVYDISRRLIKRSDGTAIRFQEENRSLELRFSYTWELSRSFGFIRTSSMENLGPDVSIDYLDGVRNLLPAGIERVSQERLSTLLDGYKQAQLLAEKQIGVYTLGSILSDRAEPNEALRASTVFHVGPDDAKVLLSEGQIEDFERGEGIEQESFIRGVRGAYLLSGRLSLEAEGKKQWLLAGNVEQDRGDLEGTIFFLDTSEDPEKEIKADVRRGEKELRGLVAAADGIQLSGDTGSVKRHYANVLYNIMRGGVFPDAYNIGREDFLDFLSTWNSDLSARYASLLESLPLVIDRRELLEKLEAAGNPDLLRIGWEYLPITFSRRHGDPSRPWNKFRIDVRKPDGTFHINYQGNWRDIFQNWEALGLSFPGYIISFVTKFLNASTADGYNPYRISREGIDWEIYDPEDPWSNIGYWGDHQIVYLGRLLELSAAYHPEELLTLLDREIFVAAHIPYRIRSFEEILKDPHNTIIYDTRKEETIFKRVDEIGSDGKLLFQGEAPRKFSLLEKLLITALTKMSNLIPGGGIWMNTQRPEWNDANNALAGYGLSVVSTAYLYRFVLFCADLLDKKMLNNRQGPGDRKKDFLVAEPVKQFLLDFLKPLRGWMQEDESDLASRRMTFLKSAGRAGERYRELIYREDFGREKEPLSAKDIGDFFQLSAEVLKETVRENRRDDQLYHSYNVLELPGKLEERLNAERLEILHLDEMLEGQVAVLSSGILDSTERESLLRALRKSRLFREDQRSYILYPDKKLPSFLDKNCIPREDVDASKLLQNLAEEGNGEIIYRDINGGVHFSSDFRNGRILKERLELIQKPDGTPFSRQEQDTLLNLYEQVFSHRRFTGRSGTFFKYEGLGSIYWHMVSKLQLAVLENPSPALVPYYREIREGIGAHKSPTEYGAFPMDAYSHTPSFSGVQQPGMTGQVKEDIISRFIELGVHVEEGKVCFYDPLFSPEELLSREEIFSYIDLQGEERQIPVTADSLSFTLCGVPVVYQSGAQGSGQIGRKPQGEVFTQTGVVPFKPREGLSRDLSRQLFERTGFIQKIFLDLYEH